MAGMDTGSKSEHGELRERPSAKPLHLQNFSDAKQKVLELNDQENKDHQVGSKKRTYGRTPDGKGTYVPALNNYTRATTTGCCACGRGIC